MASIKRDSIPIKKISDSVRDLFMHVKSQSSSNLSKLAETSSLMLSNDELFQQNQNRRSLLTKMSDSGDVNQASADGLGLGGDDPKDLSPGKPGLLGTAGTLLGMGAIGKLLLPMLPALGAVGLGAGGSALMSNRNEKQRDKNNLEDDASTVTPEEFSESREDDDKSNDQTPSSSQLMNEYVGQRGLGGMFNKGGQVPGRGPNKDTVSAMLTPGEFVMSRDAVDQWGVNTFEVMNNNLNPTTYQHDVKQLNKSMDKKVVYVPIIRNNNHTTTIRRRGLR